MALVHTQLLPACAGPLWGPRTSAALRSGPPLCPGAEQLILTWQGRHHDQEGGSPKARLGHCTLGRADLCEFPKCGNLDCIISGSGDCVRALPVYLLLKKTSVVSLVASQSVCLSPALPRVPVWMDDLTDE